MAPSARQKILTGVPRYLREEHARDPATYPAEIKAIAQYLGIARGTVYNWLNKNDKEIAALVETIEAADKKAKEGSRATPLLERALPDGIGVKDVSTTELEREIREGLAKVVWQMRGFISLVENSSSVTEAPLHMAELDAKLRVIGAVYRELEGSFRMWKDRTAQEPGRATLPSHGSCGGTLELDFDPPEE